MSGINCQAKGFNISVKRKTGDIFKQMNNYNIRDGITKRNTFVLREFYENFLCRFSYRSVILYYKQGRLEAFKEFNIITTKSVKISKNS
jgi:hypothetical protein